MAGSSVSRFLIKQAHVCRVIYQYWENPTNVPNLVIFHRPKTGVQFQGCQFELMYPGGADKLDCVCKVVWLVLLRTC
jgi:hypothetical protein